MHELPLLPPDLPSSSYHLFLTSLLPLPVLGDLIHLASLDMQGPQPLELGAEPPSLMVASKAYNLSSALMCILMRSRVLNEEPLTLAGEEIVALGKRADPLSLLCYGKAWGPSCHFSIPEAFSGALSDLSDVVQLILLVDSNPFPFGYISNYTVSTKVASMAFQTQTGTQIPIEQLAAERAITVKVPNNSDQAAQSSHSPVGSTIVQPRASVSAVVTADNSNPQAGLHLRITYTVLNGECKGWAHDLPAFLRPCPGEGYLCRQHSVCSHWSWGSANTQFPFHESHMPVPQRSMCDFHAEFPVVLCLAGP